MTTPTALDGTSPPAAPADAAAPADTSQPDTVTLGQPPAIDSAPPGQAVPPPRGRVSRLFRGRDEDPRWVRPALFALLLGTALLYLIDLGASGWANSFYAAAVQSGAHSWKAFFFGSFDMSNAITVDKPPASLWVMELSGRIFGVNSWSMLVPQALEGVAAVGLLYATVRRRFTPAAGLIAGAAMALTPVATLMFRFNNPDALLVLLLVAATYCLVRSLEGEKATQWMILAGTAIGFGFLTKMMQAFLIMPGFALVYLFAAPASWKRRILDLLAGGAAVVVSAGWWIAIVSLWPASSRPYIGGSQHNSILELVFGYNGLGRLTGNETGSVGGGGAGGGAGGTSMWGATGITRLFNSEMGGQIAWLIPTALIMIVAMLWLTWRAPRTDGARAQVLLWGTWLIATGLTFSLAKGIIHPYYTVALAPAIGALVGIGASSLWLARDKWINRLFMAAAMVAAAVTAYVLLDRAPTWHPWLRDAVLIGGLAVAAALATLPGLGRRLGIVTALAAVVLGLAAPAAYSLNTASTAHTGSIPSAGPAVAGGMGGPGGGRGGFGGGPGGAGGGTRPNFGGTGTRPNFGGTGTAPSFGGTGTAGGTGTTGGTGATGFPGGTGATGRTGGAGGMGGLLDSSAPSAALAKLIKTNASAYTWTVATIGSNNAAGLQLGTNTPIMAIGGFNGSDPSPTLAQFEKLVASKKIHYYLASGLSGGGQGASGTGSAITAWVEAHFKTVTVGGQTLYDLTSPTSS